MLATIASLTFDPDGYVEIQALPESELDERRRRINRTPTLDGGASLSDFGFSHADRTITLRWVPDGRATHDAVDRMAELYASVHVSAGKSAFTAAIESYNPGTDESSLTLLVTAKTSE